MSVWTVNATVPLDFEANVRRWLRDTSGRVVDEQPRGYDTNMTIEFTDYDDATSFYVRYTAGVAQGITLVSGETS